MLVKSSFTNVSKKVSPVEDLGRYFLLTNIRCRSNHFWMNLVDSINFNFSLDIEVA